MVWYGAAIGLVGDLSKNGSDAGLGGTKSLTNSNAPNEKEGQGLITIGGHDIWLYLGGIIGFGETAGVYFTAGPMIGATCDIAVGAGVHLGQVVGLGVAVPVFKTYRGISEHHDKAAAVLDIAQHTSGSIADKLAHISSLDSLIANITTSQMYHALMSNDWSSYLS